MERKRTRAERKAETRTRLIAAAAEVIAERGFQAASLADVAERAGVTTGAIYSSFRSKEALFFAVLESLSVRLDLDPGPSVPAAERIVGAAESAARFAVGPESRRLLQLQLEFALLALRDPATLSRLVESVRTDRRALGELLQAGWAPVDPGPTPPPEGLAAVLIAIIQGLTQQRLIDPSDNPDSLFRWAVEAILHAASRQDRRNEVLPESFTTGQSQSGEVRHLRREDTRR